MLKRTAAAACATLVLALGGTGAPHPASDYSAGQRPLS
jgi:hypothetical protein